MWTARRLGSVPHRGSDRRHPARGTGARARRRGVRAGVGRVAPRRSWPSSRARSRRSTGSARSRAFCCPGPSWAPCSGGPRTCGGGRRGGSWRRPWCSCCSRRRPSCRCSSTGWAAAPSRYRSWAWRAATRWRAGGRAGPVGRRARSRSSPCRAGWSWRRSPGERSPSPPRGAPGSPCCSCPCWRCSPSAPRCRTARPPSCSPPVDGWCSWASSAGWRGAPGCGGSWPPPQAPTRPPW